MHAISVYLLTIFTGRICISVIHTYGSNEDYQPVDGDGNGWMTLCSCHPRFEPGSNYIGAAGV